MSFLLAALVANLAAATPLTIVANDSTVKDKLLPGVTIEIASAKDHTIRWSMLTDAQGRATVEVPPGSYLVTLTADDYVQLEADVVNVGQAAQTVTITLTPKLKGTDDERRQRLQIVVNWGSDEAHHVRDADAHLLCGCGRGHVYFGHKEHGEGAHEAQLDVDDMSWGGPETITIFDGPPGTYHYWVYDYSADDGIRLGAADVVVRVVSGDEVIGQYRIPTEHKTRVWRPFKAVVIDEVGGATVTPFSTDELAAGAAELWPPEDAWPPGASASEGESWEGSCDCTGPAVAFLVVMLIVVAIRAAKKRSSSAQS